MKYFTHNKSIFIYNDIFYLIFRKIHLKKKQVSDIDIIDW